MGIGHRAQSESIYYRKILFFSLFIFYWKVWGFFNVDFHSAAPGEKKEALQISAVKRWAPTAASDTEWKGEHFSQQLSADLADVFSTI